MSNIKRVLLVAVCALFVGISSAMAAFIFTAMTSNGPILLNVQTGEVTLCAVSANISNPFGKCAIIGRVTPSQNLTVVAAPGSAFIANTVSGDVWQCGIASNTSGVPTGSCTKVH